MFAESTLADLLGEECQEEFFENPLQTNSLRRSDITLGEFYDEMIKHFLFVPCKAAHHFPGVINQNYRICQWMPTNPGCTHGGMGGVVSSEFHWVYSVITSLNQRFGELIVSPRNLQEIYRFFDAEFASHPDGPDFKVYDHGNGSPDEQLLFQKEVHRVGAFQKTKGLE